MSETENFLTKSGREFQAVADGICKAVVDAVNDLCGGRLSFGEPAVAMGSEDNMPHGFSAPFAVAMCESTGSAAGPFAWIVDMPGAHAMVALTLGTEAPADAAKSTALEPNELDAFKELAATACSAVGAALRKAAPGDVSTSLKSIRTAPGVEELLDMLRDESVFIAAPGKIADMATPVLLACNTDLCSATIRLGAAAAAGRAIPKNLERILKIPVPVIVVLAEKTVPFKDVLGLTAGSVIEFDKSSAEPLMLLVNDRKVGLGRVIKMGERFGLRIEEIGGPEDIVHKLR